MIWMALFDRLTAQENALLCTELIAQLRDLFESLSLGNSPTPTPADEVRDQILVGVASRVVDYAESGKAGDRFLTIRRELAMLALGDSDGRILENALQIVRNERSSPSG